ncbi:MAG TPA: PIG-L family deacetylase, partial [Flavobacteriaceae bacterium]|nr:PIG-L family deacetylase [Flavobacteriaceae bacterium]
MKKYFSTFLLLFFCIPFTFAQAPKKYNSAEIYEAIQKLNFLGSVLYVAAHPDDENTRLISYLANDVKARTAYLSITRGDGGQNLIGPELRDLLGVIRTQELLAARKIDGGEQYFTRANDFGYSKHPNETLEIWDKDEVLNDVVTVIRKFKPDVIINRFNHKTPGSTHGHHTASAMLSMQAFELASKNTYSTHLQEDNVWQPKRLFFNTSWWFYGSRENFEKADKSNLIGFDVGSYYTSKGLSNNEIAALSRSQHQSQGFGSTGSRGSQTEYLELLKGTMPTSKNIFEGIDTSWNRVDKNGEIKNLVTAIENEYNFKNPAASLPKLLKAYQLIKNVENEYWKTIKLKEIKTIIAACAGLYLEVTANKANASKNENITLNFEVINRSNFPIKLSQIAIPKIKEVKNEAVLLNFNKKNSFSEEVKIPLNFNYTSPYWLLKEHSLGMYDVEDKSFIGLPETPKSLHAKFLLDFGNVKIPFEKEVVYKYNSPVVGEVYQPFEIIPKVTVNLDQQVYLLTNNSSKKVAVKVKSNASKVNGILKLNLAEGWVVSPKHFNVELNKDEEKTFI